MPDFFKKLTLLEAKKLIERKELTSVELINAAIERIRETDDKIGAYLWINEEQALEEARLRDERLAKGEPARALEGLPIGFKDLFIVKDVLSTAASKILTGFVPRYDGTHSRKIKEAGGIPLGKLNMDEFAMGSSNEFSAIKPCRNPLDLTRSPGGSSGGSAAAVAAGSALAALGSDTGGSIRQPAAFCGVVGVKPTYGRVSRYGMIAFASSLDQAGVFAKNSRDAAAVLGVLAGLDEMDSTTADAPVPDYVALCEGGVKGTRIGLPKEYFGEGLDSEIRDAVLSAAKTYERMGAEIVDISLPHSKYAVAVYYIIATAEASSNLARYDGVRYGARSQSDDLTEMYVKTRSEGFGAEVKRRIMLGTYVLSAGYYDAYYKKAQKARTILRNDFNEAFKSVDVILSPATPTAAFKIGEKTDDPLQMYLADIYTISVNLAGLPGMSVPCGKTADGLPIGMQLIGRPLDEGGLLRMGAAFEDETAAADWRKSALKI